MTYFLLRQTCSKLFNLISTLAFCLLAQSSLAASQSNLQPFSAEYTFKAEGKVSFEAKLKRDLQATDKGWQLQTSADTFFTTIIERSQFNLEQNRIKALNYFYQRKVLGRTKTTELNFDWQSHKVSYKDKKQSGQLAITEGILDKLSYQLQLQRDIAADKQQLSYEVATNGKLKHYLFKRLEDMYLDTPLGRFKSVHLKRLYPETTKRNTELWFAPELNYQLIKLHIVEPDKLSYSLDLIKLKQ